MTRHTQQSAQSNRTGAMLPLVAVTLPVMLMFTAFAINVAHMQLTRTELRTATDAATRAGGRTLSISQSPSDAEAAAIDAASRNLVAGDPLVLAPADLQFGFSQPPTSGGRWTFASMQAPGDPVNALRVTGRRDAGSSSGSVDLLFNGLMSRTTFEPVISSTATQIDRDIALVLDRSGSMTRRANGRSNGWRRGRPAPADCRWRDLVAAVRAFLKELKKTPQDEQVALATFASSGSMELDLSLNYGQVRSAINAHSDRFMGGSTAVGVGELRGLDALLNATYARQYAAKTIVLMTDGRHNTGQSPVPVARDAHRNHRVTVHTVTFSQEADQRLMRQVADAGNGRHWHADDSASLIDAFREIANNNPTLLTE